MRKLILILFLLVSMLALAQRPYIEFRENKGQWEENVMFRARIPAGDLFIEENALTYRFYKEEDLNRIDELHHQFIKNPTHQDSIINMHAFKVEFKNALTPTFKTSKVRPDYENYFVGNDQSKWASNVKKYEEVAYQELYKNIDLKFYLNKGILKYDFIVLPEGNPNQIQLDYKGVDELFLKNGNLHIKTSVNEIIEQKPYAYQLINGIEKEVKCSFVLENKTLSFKFPKGYNKAYPLIIDPALIFASYSGATVDNWGFTSTFNDAGNLFGGGVSFGTGYPLTLGAIQVLFGGGYTDISISKFSTNGSLLEYSTYLGGAGADYPHSLIVNSNDELLVFGTTNSPNFPTTAGAYSTVKNSGYDIYVSKFSANGQVLLASTFVGGSSNDGLNSAAPLKYNYADDHRGEIIVDANDNVYVATVTNSTDFPVTAGVIQTNNAGSSDGCVFKLSPNLNTLLFSTYIGGTGLDAAYSLQFSTTGDILVAGGTTSSNFPTTPTTLNPTSLGNTDGWVAKINNSATNLIASTYIGTASSYNQCYFVQLDTADNVFVVGQTVGGYPIFPATVYNNPNSGQFIHKLTPDLSTTVFSTTFGTSSGQIDIALSAFLVNECNYILISGWGGAVNGSALATNSTTNGLPITLGAIQPTTDGSDYYLVMFSEDANTIIYATFFGGNASFDHVDGGTSRFDKRGIVYQAVCASCFGATSDFPTTPGAWSNTDNGPNCNLGVFKMDLTNLTADAEVFTTPFYCIGDTVHFQNLSNGGVSYFWDFQDGNTSTDFQPSHVFDSVGVYHVMLIALDSISCILVDTDYVDVFVGGPPTAITNPVNAICRGDSVQLNASGGTSYFWSPNYNITNDSIDNPFVFPDTTTLYTVIVFDSCGIDTSQLLVTVFQKNISISPDTLICIGLSIQISASGGVAYTWQPATSLNDTTIANPIASPTTSTTYTVEITDANSCVWDTSVTVSVDTIVPIALTMNDTIICLGDTIHFQNLSTNAFSYFWDFQDGNTSTNFQPSHIFDSIGTYQVLLIAIDSIFCMLVDSDYVDIIVGGPPIAITNPVNGICRGDSVQLNASGGTSYVWSPNYNITNDSIDNPFVFPDTTTLYTVIVFDTCGTDTAQLLVTVFQKNISISPDTVICLGQSTQLTASSGVSYAWQPAASLNNATIANPIASPTTSTTYTVEITDANSCVWDTSVTVSVDSIVPIAITMNDTTICKGDTIQIYGSGTWGRTYNWTPTATLINPTDSNPFAFPSQNTTYIMEVINGCGSDFDTILVSIFEVYATIVDDTSVCVGDRVNLWATGGETYLWSPTVGMNNPNISNPSATIFAPITFSVAITDTNSCTTMLSVFVDTLTKPLIDLGLDIKTNWGSPVQLNAVSNGLVFSWSPTQGLSCSDCPNPIVNVNQSSTFMVTVLGKNGCYNYDTISIFFDGAIYVPNSFTPDGDGINDIFFAYGVDIIEFEMYIFDRWGEKIFYSNDMKNGWDGLYKGTLVKNDVYVWKVTYKDVLKTYGEMLGTVTLVR
ncbi:MAG: gliding motility-associated C-terminal domain-containing protein [Vicingaceae bacterium]|nr:gliding motility-associated C-terminal domain-containing protein [Vicingaceae bacterium]